jgi:hypothetical protein
MRLSILFTLLLSAACGIPTTQLEAEPAGSTAPIVAQEQLWTWVNFEDAFCANGSRTGMAVNTRSASSDVVIYLQGGGGCWEADTCRAPLKYAVHLGGYAYPNFKREDNLWSIPVLARTTPANPFKDMNMVFVPYCTGDLHAGTSVHTYSPTLAPDFTTHHVGGLNMDAFFNRLGPTYANAQRVFLVGASAGGLGTSLNVGRLSRAFPNARLFVVDDSGPPVDVGEDVVHQWTDAWGPVFPASCANCSRTPSSVIGHWTQQRPDLTFALLTFKTDTVLASYLKVSPSVMRSRVEHVMDAVETFPQNRVFVRDGAGHVVMSDQWSTTGGLTFVSWLQLMVDGSPDWHSVGR